jgi:Ca2+-binding EF-hand superfamily protein
MSSKTAALAKRAEIRNYISQERDTVVKKWRCLQENIESEDARRRNFYLKKAQDDTKVLPDTIDRFLRTLKASIVKSMSSKPGTPYSIIRNMFIYWDSGKSGTLSAPDLQKCLNSLGVHVSPEQTEEIILYYSCGEEGKMGYNLLLKDVLVGEPTIIQKAPTPRETDEDRAKRFKLAEDKHVKRPLIVERFLEAVRTAILKKLTLEGGTPYSHVRHAFLMFDHDYSSALCVEELMKAVKLNMGLTITPEQAVEIINFYDNKGVGEMDYKIFLEHVCEGMDVFLTYTEDKPDEVEARKKSMAKNPFVIKEFKPSPNKTLESFKRKVRSCVAIKVQNEGGSAKSLLKDSFAKWDPTFSGKISDWRSFQGACKRFGFMLLEDEAKSILHSYATDDSGDRDTVPKYLYKLNLSIKQARCSTSDS